MAANAPGWMCEGCDFTGSEDEARAHSIGTRHTTTRAFAATTKMERVVPLWKATDDTQRVVYGVVLQPGVTDSQGDDVSAQEIEQAAHRYLVESRKQDLQHDETEAPVEVVESYIAPMDMHVAGRPVLKGSWVMASHLRDDGLWDRVQKGEITGYSIGGTAVRVAGTPEGRPTLHNLDVEWVSLVDRAAVRDPIAQSEPMRFLVWKRDPQGAHMTADEMRAELEKAQEALKKAEEDRDAATAKAEKAETESADLAKRVEALEKAAEPARKAEEEPVNKDELPPAVRAMVEKAEAAQAAADERVAKAEKDAADAAEIAKAERETRLTGEYIAKAETLDALPIRTDQFGPVLKAAAEKLDKAQYDELERVLKAVNEQIRKSDLFTEFGRGREGDSTDAFTELQQKAAELKKADPDLTDGQALKKAMKDNPDLQARHLAEVR